MGGALLKIRTWWETADKTTRTVTIVGTGLLAALLIVVFYASSSPDFKQLFPPMDVAEQGKVIQKLQELKIPYKQEQDGSILVPSSQIAESRAKLAMAGLPSSTALGNMRLGNMGFTTPAALQDQEIRVALEEEIQKTLVSMEPIVGAKVHIAPGDESPFANSSKEPSASVVVQFAGGLVGEREVAEAIVKVVVGGVQGLRAENVSVSDSRGLVIWDGSSDGMGANSAIASRKRDAELQEASRIRSEIESMIAKSVGPGKAIVSATVELNFDREDVSTVSETPTSKPISSERVTETYNNEGGAIPGGIASSGAPAAAGTATGPSGPGYQSSQEVNNFGVEKVNSVRSVAPGKRLAARVSIMLDESVASARSQVEQFVANYLGADADPDNFKVTVQTVAFDKTHVEEAQKLMAAQKSGQMMQQIISLIPVIALVIVGFLVVRSIGKAAVNNRTMVLTAGALAPGGASSLAGRAQSIPSDAPALPQQTDTMDSLGGAARARAEMIKQSLQPEVEDIPEKFDASLIQILRMSDQKPEAVAMLIKSWLLEETR
jgi:flagellar M-ring protein FliF